MHVTMKRGEERSIRKGRPSKTESEAIQPAILEAAAAVFLSEGSAASMDRVAAVARVSKRTLYAHFPSKVHLFQATLTWLGGDLAKPAGALPQDISLEKALDLFAGALLDLYTRPRVVAFARLMLEGGSRFPELERGNRQQFHDNVTLPLKDYLDRRPQGELRDVDTQLASTAICALAIAEISRMHALDDLDNRNGFVAYMAGCFDLVLNGLRRQPRD